MDAHARAFSPVPPALRSRARRIALGLGVLVSAYLGLLVHPDPLFAHTLSGEVITAHADVPLPPAMEHTLAVAEARIRASPLFDASRHHDVYFCQDLWRWRLVSGWNERAAGIALAPLGRAVFFRPAHLDADTMIGASGRPAGGERTLGYYVAHEATHTMTADRLGVAMYDLPVWVREGYADYVARGDTFDYSAVRRQLLENVRETDPASGHYLRYVLFVAHELDVRHVSVDSLLMQPRPIASVEADVRAGR
jgi:hypothetical protein